MFDIVFQKLYRYPRCAEPCFIGLPVKKGLVFPDKLEHVGISQNGKAVPVQAKITSTPTLCFIALLGATISTFFASKSIKSQSVYSFTYFVPEISK